MRAKRYPQIDTFIPQINGYFSEENFSTKLPHRSIMCAFELMLSVVSWIMQYEINIICFSGFELRFFSSCFLYELNKIRKPQNDY